MTTMAGEYPKLYTVDWVDQDGQRRTWSQRIEQPPTADELTLLERACETSGINEAIAATMARGYDERTARQKVFSMVVVGIVERAADEAAYRRECERRGLLAL